MGAIFTTFGIDWHLLLINAVNFGLLLAGLTYFLYKPLANMLETRRQRVEQGVRDAEAATQTRQEIENSRAGLLADAGREADEVLARARANANAKTKELMADAEAAAARTNAAAEAQARETKAQAIEESKKEVAKLVVLGIEKLAKEGK